MKDLRLVALILLLFCLGCSGLIRDAFNKPKRTRAYGDNEANGSPIVDPIEAKYRDEFADLILRARQAMIDGNADEIGRVYSDDYVGSYDDGERSTKKELLRAGRELHGLQLHGDPRSEAYLPRGIKRQP